MGNITLSINDSKCESALESGNISIVSISESHEDESSNFWLKGKFLRCFFLLSNIKELVK